jgi:hypothetical protein
MVTRKRLFMVETPYVTWKNNGGKSQQTEKQSIPGAKPAWSRRLTSIPPPEKPHILPVSDSMARKGLPGRMTKTFALHQDECGACPCTRNAWL